MLERLADDLWTATSPLSTAGMQIGARMTVARLPGGGLFVHSPIRIDDTLRAEVQALGPVGFLVAPNKFHHLYLDGWVEAFPDAKLYGPIGLPEKRKDLRFDGILAEGHPDPGWGDAIDLVQFYGAPATNEVVFLHKPSRTLLMTDLAFNIHEPVNWITRIYLRIGKCHGRLKTTGIMRLVIRDKQAARQSVERIAGWDFDRIVVSHGEVQEHGGPDALRSAFEWL